MLHGVVPFTGDDERTPSGHLLQLLPEAVVQTDALWQITYLNPAWHTRTGHAQEAALGYAPRTAMVHRDHMVLL